MPSIFDEQSWQVERAVLHICFNVSDPLAMRGNSFHVDLIRDWISDPVKKQAPTDNDITHSRIKAFVDKAKKLWGDDAKSMTMHPMLWCWFAMSELKSKVRPAFWLKREQWLTLHAINGHLPVVQRKRGEKSKWGELRPALERPIVDTGVPAATLIYQKFQKPRPTELWRTVLWRTGPAADENSRRRGKSLNAGDAHASVRKSNSPGCEASLVRALSAASRLTTKIVRISEPEDGGVLFEAPRLHQTEVLDWIQKTKFHTELSDYSKSTIARSLSAIVECCRGRTRRTTDAARKVRR